MSSNRKTLNVSNQTYQKLDGRKSNGQSFDGVINDLIEEVEG